MIPSIFIQDYLLWFVYLKKKRNKSKKNEHEEYATIYFRRVLKLTIIYLFLH